MDEQRKELKSRVCNLGIVRMAVQNAERGGDRTI